MSSAMQNPDKNRRRRQRKGATDQSTTDDAQKMDENVGQNKPKPWRKRTPQPPESALTQQLQNAVTPPRPQSQHVYKNMNHEQAGQNMQKGNRQKNTNNNNNQPPGTQTNIATNKQHHSSQAYTTTPSKPISDAYAGPTFHASPAASALPIPKFFSKSAPSNDQNVGITARLRQEERAGTSSGSEESSDSPSRPQAIRASTQTKQSEPPTLFDMLINADREEKARQRASQTLSPPQPNARTASNSPVNAAHRPKHSRTLTGSDMFPFDTNNTNHQNSPSPAAPRQLDPAHYGSPDHLQSSQYQPTPDDANLKRKLFSSPSQGPPPNHFYGGALAPSPQWDYSPASRPTASPYGTPASSANGLASTSRPTSGSPYSQVSPSPSIRRSQQYPPYSNSNLRSEVSPNALNHTPPHVTNLPGYNPAVPGYTSPLASPMHQRYPNGIPAYGSHGHNSPYRNASPAANISTKFSTEDALKTLNLGTGMQSKNNDLEDALRKVLRLDQLRPSSRSPSTAGVPS